MLYQYLQDAISKIEHLIALTQEDIQDLSQARNDAIFKRVSIKDALVKSFEDAKGQIDREMLRLRNQNPEKSLADLLDSEVRDLLEVMKEKLRILKDINSGYAKSVYAVNEFYTSLLRKIVPHESSGYGGYAKPQQSFLMVEV
ncbi:hypothetical protein BBW65_06875 [Helicobacter enhydrae]|uniref:Flagellar protein FlgN n=1 Tax=Helicobacter enhydrae TaxID=222136 RepID=A0A1B1U6W1_9HELI|nr:hypothetical protein [Helicobacter enhydrae]ANV98533.1 hypothetical protein BBW65_06875 [Helicobacter enhydrae]